VSADDEIHLNKFTSCKAINQGNDDGQSNPEDKAFLKATTPDPSKGECNHSHKPDDSPFHATAQDSVGSRLRFASQRGRRPDDPTGLSVWVTCSQDCCFAQ
jgi:hypothetical protein